MRLSPREDIYETLPSNMPGVHCTTPLQYTTILPTPLQLTGQWEVALLETHYHHDMRNMQSSMIAVIELTHTREVDAVAATHIVKELLTLILKTDGASKESDQRVKQNPNQARRANQKVNQHPKLKCNGMMRG